jgi:acyl-CoA thioesterase
MTDASDARTGATAHDVAERSAARMWAADLASQRLGMSLDEVRPGYARLRMTVTDTMVQGHGTAHGGYVFTLADSAFAFACNSHGAPAVAAHCDISFLTPVYAGDVLQAEAVERTTYGRNAICDVTVRRLATTGDHQSEVVAEFRGRSRTIGASTAALDGN